MRGQAQVTVVGSGFAGTILARILHRVGVEVVLVERDRHPRFALGESSTPLGAISLERLARDYGFADLASLAAYGRWMGTFPEVRRGLKRGFTFYEHQPGVELHDTPENRSRLLVAASPDDAVADSHWLREDVDHHLVRLAEAEGVEYWDRAEIQRVEDGAESGWQLSGTRRGEAFTVQTDFVIDGSGAGGLLAGSLPIHSDLEAVELDTSLVFGHFEGLAPLPAMSSGPYPDEKAAIHHLLEEGWLYVLPFDHGVASAGILIHREAADGLIARGTMGPEEMWSAILERYPTLAEQFRSARLVRPLEWMPRVQRRLAQAAGSSWAALPHTFSFLDPMFSTGIAWSLVAIERLAAIFAAGRDRGDWNRADLGLELQRYGRQLVSEADQMSRLLDGTYLAMRNFELFVAQSFLYFGTVSFEEVYQRLHPEGADRQPPAWRGFLGAGDPKLETLFDESKRRLFKLVGSGATRVEPEQRRQFQRWVLDSIADRNIAGFGDTDRHNLYPVDLDLLVERSSLLGLDREEMEANLPRLRGISA